MMQVIDLQLYLKCYYFTVFCTHFSITNQLHGFSMSGRLAADGLINFAYVGFCFH